MSVSIEGYRKQHHGFASTLCSGLFVIGLAIATPSYAAGGR